MGLFDQAKDLYKLQKQAKEIKEQLKNLHIEAEANGVVVTVSGEMEVISVVIPDALLNANSKEEMQKAVLVATNKAMKKAQELAAEKMRGMMGGMNIPGLGGGAQ